MLVVTLSLLNEILVITYIIRLILALSFSIIIVKLEQKNVKIFNCYTGI